jgi:uncharacterized membrane protein
MICDLLISVLIMINLFTGVLGPVVALIIYLIFLPRSRYVVYHAMQSFLLQLLIRYRIGVMGGIVGMLSIIVVDVILIPFACVLTPFFLIGMVISPPIYGIVGGVQTSQGQDFKYWLVSDWARGILNA